MLFAFCAFFGADSRSGTSELSDIKDLKEVFDAELRRVTEEQVAIKIPGRWRTKKNPTKGRPKPFLQQSRASASNSQKTHTHTTKTQNQSTPFSASARWFWVNCSSRALRTANVWSSCALPWTSSEPLVQRPPRAEVLLPLWGRKSGAQRSQGGSQGWSRGWKEPLGWLVS